MQHVIGAREFECVGKTCEKTSSVLVKRNEVRNSRGTIDLLNDVFSSYDDDKKKGILFRTGYQNALIDYEQQSKSRLHMEMTLLSCLNHLKQEGLSTDIKCSQLYFNFEKGDFYFAGFMFNTYEGANSLLRVSKSNVPVCNTIMGYISGWTSAAFGTKILAIESACVGMGHSCCKWTALPVKYWGKAARNHLDFLSLP